MGKKGPCRHCGATSTPLWRNGPPGKSVLCNACGSRWRTKGTLVNYTPLHARAISSLDSDDALNYQVEKQYIKKNRKNWNLKVHSDASNGSEDTLEAHYPCLSGFEEDTSNKSSSGSAISFSETCVELGSTDVNDISGPLQSGVFDFHIPSKKRTRTRCSSPSPIEMLRRDLFNILQQQELSHLSGTSEEELIFDGEDRPYFVEIGLGSVLLKPPVPLIGEESQASSMITENKVPHLHEAKGSSPSLVQVLENEITSSQVVNDRLKRDIVVRKELEEYSAKPCAVTSNHLGSTNLDGPDISGNSFVQTQESNYESSKPAMELSSCSSYVLGSEILLPAKRPPHPRYLQTNEGMGSDSRTFNRPKDQMVPQGSLTSSRCSSAISESISSSKLGSLNMITAKPLEKDSHPMASSDVFSPFEEFSYSLTPLREANLDERRPSMIFNYSPFFAPDKLSMEFVDTPY